MSFWDSLVALVQHDAQHRDRTEIPLDHIVPTPRDIDSLAAGDGYFRLWVVQMWLKNDYQWFKTWYPVVQSLTKFNFGNLPNPIEIAQVAGPGYLRDLDPTHLDSVVQVDCPLTPLVPFSGGTVQVEVGLMAMQADAVLKRFLDVIGNFAGLLAVPQLSTALNIASAVSQGAEQLLGVGGNRMHLGYQATMVGAGGGGNNDLRPTYIAILNAPSGTYPPDMLWIKDSKLQYGADLDSADEITGVDYLLLRVETRKYRDDWDALSTINEPFTRAISALSQVDANGNVNVADAEVFIRGAVVAALNSPDLTARDRPQVARAIRERYNDYKQAVLGTGAAVLGTRGVETPNPPTLSEVALAARKMADDPVTVGELFAE